MADDSSSDLRDRLESLPQELYDEIFDLTFTADQEPREITQGYRPPVQLQVSRGTRQKFSQTYYGEHSVFHVNSWGWLVCWLLSLEKRHYESMRVIELRSPHPKWMDQAMEDSMKSVGVKHFAAYFRAADVEHVNLDSLDRKIKMVRSGREENKE